MKLLHDHGWCMIVCRVIVVAQIGINGKTDPQGKHATDSRRAAQAGAVEGRRRSLVTWEFGV
jgi:hypothetical protein